MVASMIEVNWKWFAIGVFVGTLRGHVLVDIVR